MSREFTAEQLKHIEQMGAIMDILTIAYPLHYKNATEDEKYAASCLWAEMFASDPIDVVIMAVKSFIATDTKGFPPIIGIIKDHVLRVTTPPQKSALEAWSEVKKALSNSAYNAAQEFEKLDPVIKRIVGSPSQLKEWAQVETNVLDTVIASNFRESYNACAKNFRERQALPPAISEMVNLLAASKDLTAEPPEREPKALPISVTVTISELKEAVSGKLPDNPHAYKPPTAEEFEKKRAERLAQIQEYETAEVMK